MPIETSSRELLYKVYLCNLLAEEGFICYLGSKNNINNLTKNLKNYIYLDKGYHAGVSELIYKQIQKNNGIIVNLDEEGAVDFSDNSTLKERYAPQLFKFADIVFLWGKKQYALIKSQSCDIKNVFITGHPRFELLKPKYHFLYMPDVHKIKKEYGNFTLINTNMGFGNNLKGDKFVINNYENRFNNIRRIVKFDKLKTDAFIELALELSKDSDQRIIIRPHPEEDINYYKKAFQGINNIKVIYKGSVVAWLLAADHIIHSDCTTAVEASFLGKLPISYMPKNYPNDIITKIPLEVSIRFDNITDVKNYVTKNTEYICHQNRDEVLEEYFSYSQPTIKLIVNELKSIKLIKSRYKLQPTVFSQLFYLKLKDFINLFRKNQNMEFVRKKLEDFNYRNIKDIQARLNENIELNPINIKKLNSHLFSFKKNI